jgi:hypothetical protein
MYWMLGAALALLPTPQMTESGHAADARPELRTTPSTAAAAVFDADDAFVRRAVEVFRHKSGLQQKKILSDLRAALAAIDDPYSNSLREVAARGGDPRSASGSRRWPWREARQVEPLDDAGLCGSLPFAAPNQYRFGFGSIVAVAVDARARRPRFPASPTMDLELEAALRGLPFGADLALAGLLRELDNDRGGDLFAVFLTKWRDGSESMYRAIDRAAGTGGGVFFADAMLDEYVRHLVPDGHADAKRLRRGREEAHEALHQSFVAYRRYRAMREAVALAMVLPPQIPLPGVLSAFEARSGEGHTFRERVDILLHLYGGDVNAMVAAIVAAAPPLPDPLWEGYDPFPAFSELFHERLRATELHGGDSDRILLAERRRRAAIAARIAGAARDVLARAGIE